ncbi:carcinoembryonic antigen-related cell adhesion molecule 20 isoform X2 [Heterocephalus glaber]|uniref:Carcinoembryonic antigen-related cell adhesion molecule 20 isoform X2 n=1 Tax=Heterocephalus glaber TaxID=10181 RepID=A0AAX6SF35_HETGA|nr:carcinoembryonic antigen-related cell adhesion molecule 20 isoform X2 [Heterocephalus glaber]
MGLAALWSCWWTGVLLSASLLTIWNLPAEAQLALQAGPPNTQKLLAKPTISTSQGIVIEHRGVVTFRCYTVNINVSIHWVSNNIPLVLNERMQLSADGKSLTIFTVQREDAGIYQCEVWGASEVQSSDITLLEVYYGPDPVEIKVDSGILRGGVVEVTKGSTVNFQAETQSYPAATYTWYLPNDSILPPTTRTLTIPAVSGKDEGIYRCLVFNSATHMSHLGALKVLVLASQQSLAKPCVVSPSMDFVENTSSVALTCQSTYEGISVRWFREGRALLPSERLVLSTDNRTLVIHSLQRDDTGPYQCEIWTWDREAWSDPLWLTINYGPDRVDITRDTVSVVLSTVEVKLDSNLTLQCWAESQPGAQYCWSCEHLGGEYTGGQLVITAVTWAHQGACSCTASNPLTGLARSASILVHVVGSQSPSLSAGTIAGIVTGVLSVIALVAGLGYYSRKAGWLSKILGDDPVSKASQPTSGRKHSTEPSADKPRPLSFRIPEIQEHTRVNQTKLPPAIPGGFALRPRNPQSKLPELPVGPFLPEKNRESNYQTLIHPDDDIYCQIGSKA